MHTYICVYIYILIVGLFRLPEYKKRKKEREGMCKMGQTARKKEK